MAKVYTKKLLILIYLVMLGLNIILFAGAPYIAGLYHLEEKTINTVILLVKFYSIICTLIWPLAFPLPNALRAVQEVKFTMVVSIVSMWTWRIGFSYLLGIHFGLGILGVWICMGIDWVCRAVCFTTRFFLYKWQNRTDNIL
jgi:Na+-driven multidrug efflux pump